MHFEFAAADHVCAASHLKGTAVGRGGLVPNAESYGAMGLAPRRAALPEPMCDWLAAEHGVIGTAW